MSEREEAHFAELVRRQAPAARDPMFRFKVLERRETESYHRRSWLFAILAVVAIAVAAVAVALPQVSIDSAAVILFGIGLSAAGFYFAPVLLRRLDSLRR